MLQISSASGSSELLVTLVRRLKVVEQELGNKNGLVADLQRENEQLKRKMAVVQETISQQNTMAHQSILEDKRLKRENELLRQDAKNALDQVREMKRFLNDYGLEWVGDEAVSGAHGSSDVTPNASSRTPTPPTPTRGPGPPSRLHRRSHLSSASTTHSPSSTSVNRSRSVTQTPSKSKETTALPGTSRASTDQQARGPRFTGSALPQRSHANEESQEGVGQRTDSVPQMPFQMQALKAAVDELNTIAGDGCGYVVKGRQGEHRISSCAAVSMVVWRDGVQIHRSQFRAWGDPHCMAAIRDVFEGYFPFVLKRDFPDGVKIELVDRSFETFASSSPQSTSNIHSIGDIAVPAAPLAREAYLQKLPQTVIRGGKLVQVREGVAKILGSTPALERAVIHTYLDSGTVAPPPPCGTDAAPSTLLPAVVRVAPKQEVLVQEWDVSPESRQRMPAAGATEVITCGKPCFANRNHSLESADNAGENPCQNGSAASGLSLVASTAAQAGSKCSQSKPTSGDPATTSPVLVEGGVCASRRTSIAPTSVSAQSPGAGRDITTLQVKREDGKQTYVLKLRFEDTIRDLQHALDSFREMQPGPKGPFEIRSAFPNRTYSDPDETLEHAKLVPNATLFLKAVAPAESDLWYPPYGTCRT